MQHEHGPFRAAIHPPGTQIAGVALQAQLLVGDAVILLRVPLEHSRVEPGGLPFAWRYADYSADGAYDATLAAPFDGAEPAVTICPQEVEVALLFDLGELVLVLQYRQYDFVL